MDPRHRSPLLPSSPPRAGPGPRRAAARGRGGGSG
jgi:hypothetical protein